MGRSRNPIPAEQRFMDSFIPEPNSGCWIWTEKTTSIGYGRLSVDGKATYAHRYSFELFKSKIPSGLFILHSCHNPPCVNPAHLRHGTAADNMKDRSDAGRHPNQKKTHCPAGHDLKAAGKINSQGSRVCIICNKNASRRYYQKWNHHKNT